MSTHEALSRDDIFPSPEAQTALVSPQEAPRRTLSGMLRGLAVSTWNALQYGALPDELTVEDIQAVEAGFDQFRASVRDQFPYVHGAEQIARFLRVSHPDLYADDAIRQYFVLRHHEIKVG